MKILWLNAGLLLPLDKGGKLRTWHVMRHLAKRHDITYVSFEDAPRPRPTAPDDGGLLAARDRAADRRRQGHVALLRRRAPLHDRSAPYAVAKYRSAAYRTGGVDSLASERFDLVVCDFLPPVSTCRAAALPVDLFTHNVEAEIWRRHAEQAANPVSKRLLTQQWQRMLRFERGALARFDLVLAVSDADARTFARLLSRTAWRAGARRADRRRHRLLHARGRHRRAHAHGLHRSMDWLPNEDGMTYLLPRDPAEDPQSRPERRSASSAARRRRPCGARRDPGVEVTGRVDDVRPHIARGSVYSSAADRRRHALKIFEAMADGQGRRLDDDRRRGLPVPHGHDIVIADEPAASRRPSSG
jgi:hypothetical protein